MSAPTELVCRTCDPPPREGEHHVGVRFGHASWLPLPDGSRARWSVDLDGAAVEWEAVEALAGRDGWILVLALGPGRTCSRCGDSLWERRRGEVRVSMTVE